MTTLPKPPREVPRQTSLDGLAPGFAARLRQLLRVLEAGGFMPVVAETVRTAERQAFLYGFGRTYDDGRGIVTRASSHLSSLHGYGLAADVWNAALPKPWMLGESFRRALRGACLVVNLRHGDDWNMDGSRAGEQFLDGPHVQWAEGGMGRSPTPDDAALLATQGMEAVWKKYGASAS
jgi:hypothetical protein